jgi:hypothetical protein
MPTNSTAFALVLATFGYARSVSDAICMFGWALLACSLIIEWCLPPGVGYVVSQCLGLLSVGFLFIGFTTVAYWQYVDEVDIHEIVRPCAPVFDLFVEHLIRNLIGLASTQ